MGLKVQIRHFDEKDAVAISALCIDAFSLAVAPSLSHEGVETFKSIASVDSLLIRMSEDNMILVCEEHGRVVGVVELKEGRHIAMLFVSPDYQKRGVGRDLISAILPFASAVTVTVSASHNSVPAYLKYGFTCAGDPDIKSGLAFQPMQLKSKKSRIDL